MKKNNKGFTLIELLVAIVIMISILTLAIISFNNISKEKKKEARKKVEEQAELAAKEFFEANEYQFEDMTVGSTKTILLEELVENGYITSLTDPVSGKKFNKCNYVSVTKKSNKYEYKFSDDVNCNPRNTYVSTIVDPQTNEKLKIKITINDTTACDKEGNNYNESIKWCKGKVTYELSEPICEKKNGESTDCPEGNYFENDTEKGNQKIYEYSDNSDTIQEVSYKYCASDDYGNCSDPITEKYIIDSYVPEISYVKQANDWSEVDGTNYTWSSKWTNKDSVDIPFTVTDETSGVDFANTKYYWNKSKLNKKDIESGNYDWDNNIKNYKDAPADNSIDVTSNDFVAEKYIQEGIRKNMVVACDKAGNCTKKEATIRIDRTLPTIEYTNVPTNWKKTNVTINYSITDTYSGLNSDSLELHWNQRYLTEAEAKEEDYKWQETEGNYKCKSTDSTCTANSKKISATGNTTYKDEGFRKNMIVACDIAGNCTKEEATIKIDKTAPVITVERQPVGIKYYCTDVKDRNGVKDSNEIYTRFRVEDNLLVNGVRHYLNDKGEAASYFNSGALISVENGEIYNGSEYTNYSNPDEQGNIRNDYKSGIGTVKLTSFYGPNFKSGFRIARAWKHKSSEANKYHCGTISSGSKQGLDITAYCNYVSAEDGAGNRAYIRVCYNDEV